MKILRTLGSSATVIATSALAFAAWCWLFYASPLALWWRREYLYAALVVPALAALVATFMRSRHMGQRRAWLATGVTVTACLAVAIAAATFMAAAVAPWAVAFK